VASAVPIALLANSARITATAVAHRSYRELSQEDLLKKVVRQGVVIDVVFPDQLPEINHALEIRKSDSMRAEDAEGPLHIRRERDPPGRAAGRSSFRRAPSGDRAEQLVDRRLAPPEELDEGQRVERPDAVVGVSLAVAQAQLADRLLLGQHEGAQQPVPRPALPATTNA